MLEAYNQNKLEQLKNKSNSNNNKNVNKDNANKDNEKPPEKKGITREQYDNRKKY